MKTIKVSEAIAQGYTRFRMGTINDMADSFYCLPLTKENIERYTKRGADQKFDRECEEEENKDGGLGDLYFGTYPILCEKAKHPSVSSSDLIDWLVEHNELDEELVPASLETMHKHMGEEEDFKKGLELINKAMAEYKSYTDTDIQIILDEV